MKDKDKDPVEAALSQTCDLVVRAQDGDAEAREALFGRYEPRLRKVVRRRMSAEMRAQCESIDITQQAFVNAVRCFERFEWRGKQSFIGWLAKIAEHTLLGMRDHSVRRPKLVADEGVEAADDRPGIDSAIVHEEIVEAARRAVEGLPATHREIIRMRYELDQSWQEIADAVGKPSADAARQSHTLVLAKLLRRLGRLHPGGRA